MKAVLWVFVPGIFFSSLSTSPYCLHFIVLMLLHIICLSFGVKAQFCFNCVGMFCVVGGGGGYPLHCSSWLLDFLVA